MKKLVLASSNPGKLREFRQMLEPLGIEVIPQSELSIPDAEEPFGTFVENALAKARHAVRKGKADFATIALAKAELLTGNEEAGLKLLEAAVSADHENPRVKQMIGNALKDTGHEDKVQQVIESAAAGLEGRVKDARKLLRDSQIDAALAAIESAVKDYPENTGVLLQAAQINCMSLRLKNELNAGTVERVRIYLQRLEKLMPASDRVTQMRRYFRETLSTLQDATLQP